MLVVWRLVVRDVRRRPGEALMFVLAVAVATACVTLGLAMGDAVAQGYARTREATLGPDVTAITTAEDPGVVAGRIAAAPGVLAQADPVFAFSTGVGAHGRVADAAVEGRGSAPSVVDRPLVTSGSWVRAGGAVVERGFAEALGVEVGDRVRIGGRGYPVVGIAVSAATPVYPWSDWAQGPGPTDRGGRVWLTQADARAAAGGAPGVHLIHVRLVDPDAAARWSDVAFAPGSRGEAWVNTRHWQGVVRTDMNMVRGSQPVLVVGGWLLAASSVVTLGAIAVVRAARERRRVGLLKAVGAGPGTVAAVLLARYLVLTAVAAGVGLLVGAVLAPVLADPSAGLLKGVGAPGVGMVVCAVVVAAAVALAGTVGPVVRAARTSTVRALAEPGRRVVHRPWLGAVTACLPVPLLVGVRLLARRPGRGVLTAVGVGATSVVVTGLLALRTEAAGGLVVELAAVDARTGQVLLGVTVAMVVLSALNTVFLGWSGAVQARRALGVTRVLGATPGQVVAALCTAQVVAAVPAVVVGVGVGIVLYGVVSAGVVVPAVSWLVVAGLVMVVAVAVLTALPGWVHTRGPAGRVLGAEGV
ncbi:FtsX-like permease family protein [Nocardiopsis dassonvillei]|uniref:FtsX-like permease family protein n=1 Tax=Nocardiopsis dassonvillei TaxID=2014 RepID=UPI0033C7B25E